MSPPRAAAVLCLPLLAALAGPARALQTNAGGNGADFLRFGGGARALGMGEAYGPVAEGPEAIYWNPAGLAQLRRPEVSYTRSEFLDFFHHDFFAYGHPVGPLRGTLAASFTRLSQTPLAAVTNGNMEVGRFSPHSEAVSIAYAHAFEWESDDRAFRDYFKESWNVPGALRPLRHRDEPWSGTVMAGVALKVINETLYDQSASAVALDAGAIFRPVQLRELSLSGTVRNLGTRERFIKDSQSLPLEMDLGIAYDMRWWTGRFLPALELALPYYGNPHAKVGVEYRRSVADGTTVAVRAGYKSQPAAELSPTSGITFGLGARIRHLGVDFGFEPMAELGQVYRLGVSWAW